MLGSTAAGSASFSRAKLRIVAHESCLLLRNLTPWPLLSFLPTNTHTQRYTNKWCIDSVSYFFSRHSVSTPGSPNFTPNLPVTLANYISLTLSDTSWLTSESLLYNFSPIAPRRPRCLSVIMVLILNIIIFIFTSVLFQAIVSLKCRTSGRIK